MFKETQKLQDWERSMQTVGEIHVFDNRVQGTGAQHKLKRMGRILQLQSTPLKPQVLTNDVATLSSESRISVHVYFTSCPPFLSPGAIGTI